MSMPAAWMPGAVRKPIFYRRLAGKFTSAPLGWILHVVVGNGSPYWGFVLALIGRRRFSHFWVSKTGRIEQYAETWCISWAQGGGNPYYWSVETEGYPTESLTAAQVQSLAKIHNFLGTPDAIAHVPGQRGIGTHYMGRLAWGGHSCPDPVGHEGQGPRSKQRAAIIAASHPAPTPPPSTSTGENEMRSRFYFDAAAPVPRPVYVGDGTTRRWVTDGADLAALVQMMVQDGYPLWYRVPHAVSAAQVAALGVLQGPDYNPTTHSAMADLSAAAPDGTH